MSENLSARANEIMEEATNIARAHGGLIVKTPHLLAATARGAATPAARALQTLGITEAAVRQQIAHEGSRPPKWQKLGMAPGVRRAMQKAAEEAAGTPVEPEHLVLGIFMDPDADTTRVMRALGLSVDETLAALRTTLNRMNEP